MIVDRQVVFKLDNAGNCQSIHRNDFDKLVGCPMHGWTNLEFRRMAVSLADIVKVRC